MNILNIFDESEEELTQQIKEAEEIIKKSKKKLKELPKKRELRKKKIQKFKSYSEKFITKNKYLIIAVFFVLLLFGLYNHNKEYLSHQLCFEKDCKDCELSITCVDFYEKSNTLYFKIKNFEDEKQNCYLDLNLYTDKNNQTLSESQTFSIGKLNNGEKKLVYYDFTMPSGNTNFELNSYCK